MTAKTITPATRVGPGEYRPDPSEGIQRAEDLPKPKVVNESRNFSNQPCPRCGRAAYRDRVFHRQLHDVGELASGRPHEISLTYSQHYCSACRKYFSVDVSDLAPPGGHYTHRVMALAVRSVVEDGLAYRPASWRLWRDHRVFVPFATIQNWVEAGGEKGD
jgi:transposase